MNPGIFALLLFMALLLAGAVVTYERIIAQLRWQLDYLIADAEAEARSEARDRHPSARQYGGGNLRVVRDA